MIDILTQGFIILLSFIAGGMLILSTIDKIVRAPSSRSARKRTDTMTILVQINGVLDDEKFKTWLHGVSRIRSKYLDVVLIDTTHSVDVKQRVTTALQTIRTNIPIRYYRRRSKSPALPLRILSEGYRRSKKGKYILSIDTNFALTSISLRAVQQDTRSIRRYEYHQETFTIADLLSTTRMLFNEWRQRVSSLLYLERYGDSSSPRLVSTHEFFNVKSQRGAALYQVFFTIAIVLSLCLVGHSIQLAVTRVSTTPLFLVWSLISLIALIAIINTSSIAPKSKLAYSYALPVSMFVLCMDGVVYLAKSFLQTSRSIFSRVLRFM